MNIFTSVPYSCIYVLPSQDSSQLFAPVAVGGPVGGEAKTSSSSDSCVKPDLSSLDTNPELGNKSSSSPSLEIGSVYIGEFECL